MRPRARQAPGSQPVPRSRSACVMSARSSKARCMSFMFCDTAATSCTYLGSDPKPPSSYTDTPCLSYMLTLTPLPLGTTTPGRFLGSGLAVPNRSCLGSTALAHRSVGTLQDRSAPGVYRVDGDAVGSHFFHQPCRELIRSADQLLTPWGFGDFALNLSSTDWAPGQSHHPQKSRCLSVNH